MPIAPSPYFRQRAQQVDPHRRSRRAQRDDELRVAIQRVWNAHHQVYGPRKVWRQLRREGIGAAHCTVRRLMRGLGLVGTTRGRAWTTTTVGDGVAPHPPDLVDRRFTATRPNQLWVSDFTYVAMWHGFVYAAFVIDVFAPEQGRWLRAVVRGHTAYYGVPTNAHRVRAFRTQVAREWHRSLNRRSQRGRRPWSRMRRLVDRWLPMPRIEHPWPEQRFDGRTQGKSPVR